MNLAPLDLYSRSGGKLLDSIASLASAELAALAGRLTRVFTIASPFAPGLHCIGGEIAVDADPALAFDAARLSVAGNGETLESALVSCLGEAADYLSQFERPGDIRPMAAGEDRVHFVADGWIAEAMSGAGRTMDWMVARLALVVGTAAGFHVATHPSFAQEGPPGLTRPVPLPPFNPDDPACTAPPGLQRVLAFAQDNQRQFMI